jgi:hypothetical protein
MTTVIRHNRVTGQPFTSSSTLRDRRVSSDLLVQAPTEVAKGDSGSKPRGALPE